MLGSRFTAQVYVDGQLFTNQLVHGDSDNNKKKLVSRVINNFKSVMVPKWMAERNVIVRVTDRQTGETFDV